MRLTSLEKQYRAKIEMLEHNVHMMQKHLTKANGYAPEVDESFYGSKYYNLESDEDRRKTFTVKYFTREEFLSRGSTIEYIKPNPPLDGHESLCINGDKHRSLIVESFPFGEVREFSTSPQQGFYGGTPSEFKDLGIVSYPDIKFDFIEKL